MIPQTLKRRMEGLLARLPLPAGQPGRRVVALAYHSVHPTRRHRSVTPEQFEWHLRWLEEHCDVVPLSRVRELAGGADDGRPAVAITFDDGYEDNHSHALPALAAHGFPATFFVTSGLVDAEPAVMARFAALWGVTAEEVRGMTWSQVRELRSAGMEIGAHTHTHPNLARIDEVATQAEMTRSKEELEDHLQQPVTLFAYPFGNPRQHFTAMSRNVAARVGFELAASVQFRGIRQSDDPFDVLRFPVTSDSLDVLRAKVQGRMDAVGYLRQRAPMWMVHLSSTESNRRLAS